ncbi:MAG TPA: polyphenol oxidase family protein [bacterium]|nr:polyphenol oxidase family protein [bacterium]
MKIIEAQTLPALFVEQPDAKEHLDDLVGALAAGLGLTAIHRVRQVHGDHIVIDDPGEGDGLIITKRGTGALIRTADCFPVVIADEQRPLAGIFHCGWRGVELQLAAQGARRLKELGARSLRAALFPGIEKCCFRIGPELIDRFDAAGIPVERRQGELFADLGAAIVDQLVSEGVGEIEELTRCTACTPGLFSYRRDHDERRHATMVWLPAVI